MTCRIDRSSVRSRRHLVAVAALAVLALGACGGAEPSDSVDGTSGASAGSTAPMEDADAAPTPFAATGEPTGLVAGGTGAAEITPTLDGRTCTVPDLFGTCVAANGSFVVTALGDPVDSSVWNVVVYCGLEPAVPVASLRQVQSGPGLSQLSFAPYGEVIGVQIRTATESSLFVVYERAGESCPSVHGAGALDPASFVGGGQEVALLTRPDGSLACLSVDPSGAFVTAERQESCPLG
jgi:hypothetical protein